jgi:hypothetical protein
MKRRQSKEHHPVVAIKHTPYLLKTNQKCHDNKTPKLRGFLLQFKLITTDSGEF